MSTVDLSAPAADVPRLDSLPPENLALLVERRGSLWQTVVTIARTSWRVRATAFVALLSVAALSLRISLTNAFAYAHWADARSYAAGASRALTGVSPYTDMQLVGPYALDEAIWGFGFVYPPTAAYLLAPFTLGPPFWYAWNVASIFALVGIVLLMVRREAGHLSVRSGLVVGALAVVAFQVGITDLRTGHLSPMLAAAVGSMWLWPRWSAIPALVFGFIKIIPAMGIAWAIRQEGAWKAPLVIAGLFAGLVCVFHPGWFVLWLTALGNAQPACPSYALPSLACIGFPPALGYVAGLVLLLASWRAARADVSFLLLGLAMIAPLPDLYWGNLMVPMVAAIPLLMRLARQWATRLPGNAIPDQGIVEEQLAEPASLKPPALVGTNLQS